ncbi:MAG TPA: transglycosylase SLT domain-containing protein [Acidimicrobiia bacterium]
MRFRIAPTITTALVVMAVTVTTMPVAAQDVEDAQRELDVATKNAEQAAGLVDEAMANRAEIELQLADSIARAQDLAAALSEVGVSLDTLAGRVSHADLELAGIADELEATAVETYMDALGGATSLSLVSTASVEEAMVASSVIEEVVNRNRTEAVELLARRRGLQDLQQVYLQKESEFASLKAEMDAEVARLVALYEEADADLAEAIRRQQEADEEYRAALDAVEMARIRDEERRRQQDRPTPTPPATTTTSPGNPTTTAPPSNPTTTEPKDWSFPPQVERWRDLVSQYFPAARVDEALAVMRCESGGDPDAYNPYSGASGLFQFLPSTWETAAPKAGFPDASPFDPEPNIGTAAWLGKRYEALGLDFWRPWSCRRVLG